MEGFMNDTSKDQGLTNLRTAAYSKGKAYNEV